MDHYGFFAPNWSRGEGKNDRKSKILCLKNVAARMCTYPVPRHAFVETLTDLAKNLNEIRTLTNVLKVQDVLTDYIFIFSDEVKILKRTYKYFYVLIFSKS